MVAGSSSSNDKLPKRQKTTEEERMSSQSAGMFMRVAVFKELIHKEILDGRDVEVSFDDFPYYLSDRTKFLLMGNSMHLKYSEQPQYISVLRTMKQRILLHGPAGSEIYEEMLAKALANYSEAKLLIFDRHSIMAGLFAREAELQEEGNSVEKSNNTAKQNSGAFVGTRCSPAGTSKNHVFKLGDRVQFIGSCVSSNVYGSFPSRVPTSGYRGIVALPLDDNPIKAIIGVNFDIPIPGVDFAGPCPSGHGYLYFCNAKDLCLEGTSEEDIYTSLIPTLFEAVCSESRSSPFILFIKDAMKSVVGNVDLYAIFKSRLENLPKNVIVIGSTRTPYNHKEKESFELMHDRGTEFLQELFPNKVTILPPQDKSLLVKWKQQLGRDSETIKMKGNHNCLRAALFRRGLECDALETICIKEQSLTNESAEEVVTYALIHHAMQNSEANLNAISTLLGDSIQHGLQMLEPDQNESNISKSLMDVVTENRFEETLLHEVIPPNDIGLTYEDIGGLENVKERLKELMVLPLQGPEHFCEDQLFKGILLFGPPGTGKTMLAKAVAAETGANFISLSMSSITSKCFGDEEKYMKAVFTLASKIAPSVVLLDEVDSMFFRRENGWEEEDINDLKSGWKIPREYEDMHKVKNEFMVNWGGLHTQDLYKADSIFGPRDYHRWEREDTSIRENPREFENMRQMKNDFMVYWDGLRTKDRERVLVLAITSRPYDLDDVTVRGLPHRLMVSLPDASDRAKILKVILSEQDLSADVDLNLVAKMTPGYSGSDLKNLCETAADYPIREFLEKERKEHSAAQAEGKLIPPALSKEDLRPLNIDDLKKAHKQVCVFVKSESEIMRDFQYWNTLYCEGDAASTNYFTYLI